MTTGDERLPAEEPWEDEIGAMLRALPVVEPPNGFLAAALNHRPLHAGRTMVALLAATALAIGLALVVGLSDPSVVLPELDAFRQRHLSAQADITSAGEAVSTDELTDGELTATFLAARLGGYELTAVVETDEVRQSIYRDDDGATFSVFVSGGVVDWDGLDPDGLTEVGETRAWIDRDGQMTVVQVGGETVTIVGLGTDEVETLLTDVPDDATPLADRAQDLVSTIVAHLGFPAS